jgi:hypothetical protein
MLNKKEIGKLIKRIEDKEFSVNEQPSVEFYDQMAQMFSTKILKKCPD